MSVVFGIDPGSHVTGFGILRVGRHGVQHLSHGIIRLPSGQGLPERLKVLFSEMRELLNRYKPDEVVIEKIFLGKSADSAFKLGHARGIAMCCAAEYGASVYEYATRTVKKSVAGTGSADKTQVCTMMKRLLRLDSIEHLDASDALALAWCRVQKRRQIEEELKHDSSLKGISGSH